MVPGSGGESHRIRRAATGAAQTATSAATRSGRRGRTCTPAPAATAAASHGSSRRRWKHTTECGARSDCCLRSPERLPGVFRGRHELVWRTGGCLEADLDPKLVGLLQNGCQLLPRRHTALTDLDTVDAGLVHILEFSLECRNRGIGRNPVPPHPRKLALRGLGKCAGGQLSAWVRLGAESRRCSSRLCC
jgi:hypothetical protein